LRNRRNAALGYFVSPHLALGAIWVWDPCFSKNSNGQCEISAFYVATS